MLDTAVDLELCEGRFNIDENYSLMVLTDGLGNVDQCAGCVEA